MDPREAVVESARVEPGMEVLDVACGAGNAAVPAAQAGARVIGLDPSEGLLAMARERAADTMVELDWVEGRPEELPFEDARFDRVLSVFGHMFSPDHEQTAAEMRRVCRRGGAIATACWTPDGAVGRLLEMVVGPAPAMWGTEAHARELLGDGRFERREYEWWGESADPFASFLVEGFGSLLHAWAPREELRDFLERENLDEDGGFRFRGEYLLGVFPR